MSINKEGSPNPSAKLVGTINGIAKELSKFSSVTYLDDLQLSDGLLSGSIRSAAVIACSDMGWLVPYVCSSANVQLFLFQNFGHDFTAGGFVETVVGQGVEHVVVYGHSLCEYTRFLAKSALDQSNRDIQSFKNRELLELYSVALDSDNENNWKDLAQFNVLSELKRLLDDPAISSIAAQGRLKLHGWLYESRESQLEVFDPKHQTFMGQKFKLPDSVIVRFVPDVSRDLS